MKTCTFGQCNKKHDSHGYCANHARQYRKYGHPLTKAEISETRRKVAMGNSFNLGKKWSEEARKAASEKAKGIRKNTGRTHFKKGQESWNKGKKMQNVVWNKGKRLGYEVWNKGKAVPDIQGERNPAWKGDKVSYRSLHKWVERYLGKPNECEDCGKSGLTAHQIHWSNISGEYKRDTNDWQRLCAKCHGAYDKELRKQLNVAGMRG